jgi:predicted O-methyltransferase YrrM
MLISLTNSKKIIEIGVFLGYSTTAFAEKLTDNGKIIAIDNNEKYTNIPK